MDDELKCTREAPLDRLSEDQLLLRETVNFLGGEIAGALASLRIGALGDVARLQRHVRSSIQRLEATAECLGLLVQEPSVSVRVDKTLERLCRAIATWRNLGDDRTVVLELAPVQVSGQLARRINLIAAELIGNAFRHALEKGATTLRLVLFEDREGVTLAVIDNGPGSSLEMPLGSGMGLRLASELVRRLGGWVFCKSDQLGSLVKVRLPHA